MPASRRNPSRRDVSVAAPTGVTSRARDLRGPPNRSVAKTLMLGPVFSGEADEASLGDVHACTLHAGNLDAAAVATHGTPVIMRVLFHQPREPIMTAVRYD